MKVACYRVMKDSLNTAKEGDPPEYWLKEGDLLGPTYPGDTMLKPINKKVDAGIDIGIFIQHDAIGTVLEKVDDIEMVENANSRVYLFEILDERNRILAHLEAYNKRIEEIDKMLGGEK